MKYMIVHVCVCVVHMLMQVSAVGGAWGVPRGCLVCAKCVHDKALRHNLEKTRLEGLVLLRV